jgi:predicted ArsR family transcriptional regulator
MPARADDELWSAVADPSRRQVLDLLVSNGEVSASWLAGRVPFSRQAVSKHLAELAAQWDRRLSMIKRLAETAHAENKRRRPS